ncbi:hypothetical protein L596_018485 [Steinernema carpocapsae]|uniref:Uncharacterized protein n=1 Tax=Steinernema carpocapsae TaxID=34508 RepID=A0A4U5N5H6_STECR|nr:hypothetical protein L596_018485 [Steinernema carpocapsae]
MLIPSLHTPFFACSISQPLIPSSSKSATFRFFPSPPSSSRNSNNSCLIRLFRRSSAASQLAQFELTVAAPLLIPSFTLAPRIILLRIAGDLFLGSSGTSQIDRSVRRTNTSHGGFWRRLRHLRPAPPEGPLLAHHESRILLHDPDRAHRLHKDRSLKKLHAALIILMGDRKVAMIVIGFQSFCLVLALFFTVLCVARRKWGRLFDVLLHAYLISILLMTLISFFAVIFIPMTMIQSYRTLTLGHTIAYFFLTLTYAASLAYQFFQKQPIENMLDYMQHNFK